MIRITVLCDNVVGLASRGIGEHGFAALIESRGRKILFDTGGGKGIIANSLALGGDLRGVQKIMISHGHADHTGGLLQVLALLGGAEVHAHPDVFLERISLSGRGEHVLRRAAGIPHSREYLELTGAEFHLRRDFHEVEDGVFLTGEVPRRTVFERDDPRLYARVGGEYTPDSIQDDQSVVLRSHEGLVVMFGCAHAGMINTLNYAREMTGEERLVAVLGGTHLGFLSEDQMDASIRELERMSPKSIAVSHCTGMRPAVQLMRTFGERFAFAHVGRTFDFESSSRRSSP